MNNTENYVSLVNEALDKYIEKKELIEKNLYSSMRYTLLAGGKRVRAALLLEFCRVCGGDVQKALPFACAIEMIHAYSLIHDDLPCMDDDVIRRGIPCNHIVYGEYMALLAGDALQSMAFDIMLSEKTVSAVGADRAARAAYILARACGARGMVGGQVIDIMSERKRVDINTLNDMYNKKTGALIIAAAEMGCILGGENEEKRKAASEYASALGLAFQIMDDILDVTSDSETFGKVIGKDASSQKSTYVSTLGIEKSKEIVKDLTEISLNKLDCFETNTDYLRKLAMQLASRNK